eukprot:jgi/Orpsp1_1/1177265/evm.model.c7180000060731.1
MKWQKWNEIENEKENLASLCNSISFLCSCLKKYYKRKCIILIDEYDKILINAFLNKYYDKMYNIIKFLFSNTFKGNKHKHFGIITGCLDLGFKDLFSGINNFYHCSLLYDSKFKDYYGFREEELNEILSHFEIYVNKNEIQKNYDGYSCGSKNGIIKKLYHPFSIIRFIDDNIGVNRNYIFNNYWINSKIDIILNDVILKSNFTFEKDFLKLLNGCIINVKINETLNLNDNYLNSRIENDQIWLLLLYSGYITPIDEEEYKQYIDQMDDQMIKHLSNEPKLEKKKDSTIIEIYKKN